MHSYTQPGTYTVTMTAVNAAGTQPSTTRTTVVSAGPPAATGPVLTTFKLAKKKIATDQKTKLKVGLSAAATVKVVLKSKHRHTVKGKQKYLKLVIRKNLPAGLSKSDHQGQEAEAGHLEAHRHRQEQGHQPEEEGELIVVRAGRGRSGHESPSGTSTKKTTKLVVVRP